MLNKRTVVFIRSETLCDTQNSHDIFDLQIFQDVSNLSNVQDRFCPGNRDDAPPVSVAPGNRLPQPKRNRVPPASDPIGEVRVKTSKLKFPSPSSETNVHKRSILKREPPSEYSQPKVVEGKFPSESPRRKFSDGKKQSEGS